MRKLPLRRVAALSMLILLTTIAFAATAQAQSPDPGDGQEVSGVDGVKWKNVFSKNHLYLVREGDEEEAGSVEPIGEQLGGTEFVDEVGTLTTDQPVAPERRGFSTVALSQLEPYLVRDAAQQQGVPQSDTQTTAVYETDPLAREMTISGGNVMNADIHVIAAPQLNWTIRVCEIPSDGGDCTDNNQDNNLVGREFFTDDRAVNPLQGYRPNITLSRTIDFAEGADGENTHIFDEGSRIRVEINASTGPPLDAGLLSAGIDDDLLGTRFVWLLRREGPSGQGPLQGASKITLRSEDSVQAAGWITDHEDNVATVLTNHTDDEEDDLGARFAVRSAFPGDLSGASAEFRIDRLISGAPNQTVVLEPGSNTSVVLEEAPSRTKTTNVDGQDIVWQQGWKLQEKYWNYDEIPPGEFRAHTSASDLRADGGAGDLSRAWDFRLADQAVQIEPFVRDSTSHLVQPGSSTTFLLNVVNAGSSTDTFDLSVRAPAATQQGWTTDVQAPGMETGNRIELDSGESTLVRVTVSAPDGVTTGSSQSFTLNATSDLDLEASQEVTLLATASNEVRQDVGIFPSNNVSASSEDLAMGPQDNETVTLYVWNDATVTNDISVALDDTVAGPNWNSSIEYQGTEDETVTVKGVPPGDVATVDVRFQTLGGLSGGESNPETVTANITGVAEESIDLEATVELEDDVSLEILDAITGKTRYMEMECESVACPTEEGIPTFSGVGTDEAIDQDDDDAVEATLVRTWVTNEGDDPRDFNLRISSEDESLVNDVEPYRCPFAFRQRPEAVQTPSPGGDLTDTSPGDLVNPGAISPQVARCQQKANGEEIGELPTSEILRKFTDNSTPSADIPFRLEPGQTAEYYVKVHHRTSASSFATSDFEFSIVTECDSDDCVASDRGTVEIRGRNGVEDESAVLVEPVARNRTPTADGQAVYDDPDNLPLVNIGNQDEDTVTRTIVPGQQNVTEFRVRVTHGASYSDDDDPAPPVTVDLSGISDDEGWEADLIPVTARNPENLPDPVDQFTFRNDAGNERLSFNDMEFLVRVHPPDGSEMDGSTSRSANVILEADSPFGQDILELTTELSRVPKLKMTSPSIDPVVQPDEGTAFGINLRNEGTSSGTFQLQTKTEGDWQVDKPFTNVTIPAQTNRSLPLVVTAPPTAGPGTSTVIQTEATWEDEVSGNFDQTQLGCETRDGEYVPVDASAPVACQQVEVSVQDQGQLEVAAADGAGATLSPGGEQTFSLEVTNDRGQNQADMDVTLSSAAPSSDWTAQLTETSFEGDESIAPGESRQVNLYVKAPDDVVQDSTHSFVVEARSEGGLVAQELLTVDIIEGQGRPVVDVDESQRLIERGSFTEFEVDVRNRGTATSNFELTVSGVNRDGWDARIEDRTGLPPEDADGDGTPDVQLPPNQDTTLFVNVTAPFEDVDRGTTLEPSFIAFTDSLQTKAEVQFTAKIQDYGVALSLPKTEVDYIPGTSKEVRYEITNTGNGNDTLNASMALQGLDDEWTVTFDEPRVRLEPGESEIVKAELQSPRSPLPSSRSVTFTAWAGTTQGAAVNQWQNRSQPFVVDILDYRSQDVDNDGFVELAVDTTPQDPSDGFPHYREVFPEGQNATLRTSLDADDDGGTDFLLDNPAEGGIDGIADIFWDPDDIAVYQIEHSPDLTYDDSPDYLIDSDGDDAVDTVWNSGNLTKGQVEEVSLHQGPEKQYIVDTSGDGSFDKYHDPASGLVTQVDSAPGQGADTVGLDTTGDDSVDTFYDTEDDSVEAATFANAGQFAQDYWYLVVLFGLVLLVGVVAIARR